jgi:uncharacterized protein (TIGR02145 family)
MNRVKVALVAAISIALAFTFSSCVGTGVNLQNAASVAAETFEDSRDGKKYKYVKIGEQTWMAENLSFNASGSVCYDNENRYCGLYGRLYNWEAATKACPSGWHLPSDEEWTALENYVGGSSVIAKHLKAKSSWKNRPDGKSGNGEDTYGFAARAGGNGWPNGHFDYVGTGTGWWSSSESDENNAFLLLMINAAELSNRDFNKKSFLSTEKSLLFSVRCIQDSQGFGEDRQTEKQEKGEAQ